MKKIKIFRVIGAALAGVSLFMAAGCSNLFENVKDSDSTTYETSQTQNKKGRLLFSAAPSARATATINPSEGFDFAKNSGLKFVLTGTLNDTTKTLECWSDNGETKAYAAMSADSILVDTGTWTFRLSVLMKDSECEVLYGIIKDFTVSEGDNPLDFGTLNEASEDDTTRSASVQWGYMRFSLTLPYEAAKGATATLASVADESNQIDAWSCYISDSYEEKKSTLDVYVEAAAGTYILVVKLYSSSKTKDKTTYLNTYTALVNLVPGLTSKGSAELTDLNRLYKITYNLNGGEFEDTTVQTSYNKYASVTLPAAPIKANYEFAGWSKNSVVKPVGTTTKADYNAGDVIGSLSSDITLYALWKPVEYTITYEFNDDKATNASDAVTKFTVETETFSLPTPTTTTGGAAFAGWYTTSGFEDGTTLTQIEKGTAKNITVYAKWLSITERIKSMTESGTIKATGEFSTGLISEINAALKELAATDGRSDVLVTLDLSDVTGLTELEDASTNDSDSGKSFYNCTNLAGIVLPNTLKTIGAYALDDCTSLTSVTIPNSVTSIGEYAFGGTALTSITIPDSVTSIGEYAFPYSLTSVTIGTGMTSINKSFSGCGKLTSVYYTGTLKQWLEMSFEFESYPFHSTNPCNYGADLYINNDKLTKVEIPSDVTSIKECAFTGCKSIEEITISDSVTSIGSSAFYGCTSLTSVTIGSGVTEIGKAAFYGCTSLTSVTISDSVTSIGSSAFYGCTSLTSVTIPDNVTKIGYYAFYGCTSLTSVIIGSGVKYIGSEAFAESGLSYAVFKVSTGWYYEYFDNNGTKKTKDIGLSHSTGVDSAGANTNAKALMGDYLKIDLLRK